MRTEEQIQEVRAEIRERYNNVDFPDVVLEPIWYGRRPNNRVDGRWAIVDNKTGMCFNVCTDAYKPVYHELIIKNVEDVAALHPEFGKPEIKVSMLADGGKLRVNLKFPEVNYQVKSGDSFNPNADVMSSYDLGWKYRVKFGAYRQVCSNGMIVGEVFESFNKRHLTSLDPNILSETINSGMLRFDDQAKLWSRWAETKVLDKDYEELWAELPFSATEKEKIEQIAVIGSGVYLPQALKSGELTVWDLHNAATQYLTHNVTSELRQVDAGAKIITAFERQF